jgi:hypothetical protein
MISTLISFLLSLLVALIVLGLLYWIGKIIIEVLPLPPPFKAAALTILLVIILLVALLWILGFFGLLGGHAWRIPIS